MEEKENYVNLILSAYYGVLEIDEYELKTYVLKDIENHLNNYINHYKLQIDLEELKKKAKDIPEKVKLQDSLIILNTINAPMELKIIIKRKIAKPVKKKKNER
jgi:hypothetical protein